LCHREEEEKKEGKKKEKREERGGSGANPFCWSRAESPGMGEGRDL